MNTTKKLIPFILITLISIFLITACVKNVRPTNENNNTTGKSVEIKTISTEDLKKHLNNSEWIIVDTRISDAYNGWRLDGVKRGGHIKGATDFSANWLNVADKELESKLNDILTKKDISKEKNIVLYDANGKDAKSVADYLASNGFENLYVYNVKEWASDDNLPMESYENYEMLVPASWINDVIKSNNYQEPYKIFEVSWGEVSEAYNNGHIPGAVHINTDEVEEGPIWNRKSDEELEKFALNNGITSNTTVILYGNDNMAPSRIAVILKYMGVEDVRVLNGGYGAWTTSGYDVEKEVNMKTPVDSFGVNVPANSNYIIDLTEAKEILTDQENSKLVDIRSWDEFIGETSGYDYINGKGRPAGDVWGHDIVNYKNIDNTMRNKSEIIVMWQENGIIPEERLAFFCGTGWRAAEVLFYADVMGLDDISLYDGGWNEWCSNPENPIEIGKPNTK